MSIPQQGPTGVRHQVVVLVTLMAVMLYLDRNCLAILERPVKHDLGLTNAQMAWLLSAFFWTYALAQVPSGWLSDRFGARPVLTLYILAWSLFTGLLGLAGSFMDLLMFRFGCGLAQAGAFPTSASILSKWVPFRGRGFASGVVSTGGRVGGVLAPASTAYLVVLVGWQQTLFLYGALGLAVAFGFWRIVRDRPADHPGCNHMEQTLILDGRPAAATDPHGAVGGIPLGPMIRNRSLWLSSLSQFGTNFGWVFLLTWLPRFLEEVHKVPLVLRGWMTSVPILIGIAGMLAGGWVVDALTRRLGLRWGRCLPLALTRFVAMASFLMCLGLRTPWGVTLALSLMALATDLGTPATWAYMQDVGGRHVGSVLGWGNMWGNLGAAASPPILEVLVRASGSWDLGFVACATAFLLSGLAALGVDARSAVLPPATKAKGAVTPADEA
jgi:ACS family glucarate transporter-like MFS transporter